MDELDRIARDAVDDVHATAAQVADTEQALADVLAGVQLTPVVSNDDRVGGRRSWQRPLLVAAASIAVLGVGAALLVNGGDDTRVVPADTPTLPEDTTGLTAATTPASTAPTAPITDAPPATDSVPATPDLSVVGVVMPHGLRATWLPGEVIGRRTVDTFGYANTRANAVVRLIFSDARELRITLGSLDQNWYPTRPPAPDLGDEGWQLADIGGEVAAAAGRSVDADTWITVEALRVWDQGSEKWGDAAFTLEQVGAVVVGLQYDASADTRPVTDGFVGGGVGATCETPTSVTGGTDRDLVLFTCDGVLGVYDGATGELTEVISPFDAWANADPTDEESIYASYVESIAVSPDGRTVWFTVGPEPVSGTTYRYELGSGVEPQPFGDGRVGDVGPDWVALTAMPGINLLGVGNDDLVTSQRTVDTLGMFVGGGSWSLDGGALAVVANGAIGIVDPVANDSIVLRAPPLGQAYTQAWFDDDGRLYGLLDDGETLQLALVGELADIRSGNAAPASVEPYGPRGAVRVDGLQLEVSGRLLDGDTVVAGGVVVAAVVP
jgi:hypothetical protein